MSTIHQSRPQSRPEADQFEAIDQRLEQDVRFLAAPFLKIARHWNTPVGVHQVPICRPHHIHDRLSLCHHNEDSSMVPRP